MKSAVAPNIFATEDVSIGTGDRNARRVQSRQVLIKIIGSYSVGPAGSELGSGTAWEAFLDYPQ